MKKAILKTLSATLVVLAMSSCLGDNNMKYEGSGYAYIKQGEYGTKMALTGGSGAITNERIQQLYARECYFINYSVNGKDGYNSEGAAIAESVTLAGDGEPLPKVLDFSEDNPQKDAIYFLNGANVQLYSPYNREGMDDHWILSFETRLFREDAKEKNVRLVATVLEKDQFDNNGKEIGKHKVVVRLYVEKGPSVIPPDTDRTKAHYNGAVNVDLSGVRSYLQRKFEPREDGLVGIIQFRYATNSAKDGETPVLTDKSIGSLSEDPGMGGSVYYMRASK